MCSLLALSAAGKCFDLANAPPSEMPSERIRDLLKKAEGHHYESLQQTRSLRPSPDRYACLLANAALMVLYGCASQCIRVRLTQNARANGSLLPADLSPTPSQWIILIRAAHTAFVSIINAADDSRALSSQCVDESPRGDPSSTKRLPKNRVFASGDVWSKGNRRFCFTIRTTCGMALDDLSDKLGSAQGVTVQADSAVGSCTMSDLGLDHHLDIEDCFAAYPILMSVIASGCVNDRRSLLPRRSLGQSANRSPR